MLAPFECLCGNFILPEPASYVFFYAFSNLRNLLYIIGEHMNKLLKDLYDCFYTPPELAATKREIEECHRALIEALGKPERRLVLKIIDAKDHISEDTSLDSFISGFRLAWRLSAELNHYDDERPARCQAAEKPGARFTLKKEDDEQ